MNMYTVTSYKVYKHTILSLSGASLSKYDGAVGNEKIKKLNFTRPSFGGSFFLPDRKCDR